MKLRIFTILICLLISANTFAQVKFEAEASREKLGLNERLRIDFKMNQDGDNFNPPDFKGFDLVGGPNQAISNSWINGKRTYQKTYSYFLKPKSRGKFKIGQAEIEIKGKTYKTTPLNVEVTAAVDKPTDGQNNEMIAADNIHLVTEVSNTNPYLNEGITVVYKLYVSPKISVNNWRPLDSPKFSNFWSQNIDIQQLQVKEGKYKGDPYRYVVLRKTVLYPQKTGELNIEPLSLSVAVKVPSQRRTIFGGMLYETVDKTIASSNRKIDVKPLPSEGKPPNFTGAVGDFKFKVTTSKQKLNATESLDAKVTVSGNGNLKLFELPKLTVPSSLEVYEPEHTENVRTNLNGMQGSISDSYTIVPQLKGKYPISPLSFSYFDVKSESYKTLNSKELMVDVENGPTSVAGNTSASNDNVSGHKQSVVSAGKQFRYLKLDANLHPKNRSVFFRSTKFWLLLLLPLLFVPISIVFGKKREARANDVAGNRIRKADKLARKYLSEAKRNLGRQTEFYVALERALHNYLKAKLSIQTGEMSKERIQDLLQERGVSAETILAFNGLLESCEFARYTPTSDVAMQQDYDKAVRVISELDKQI